MRSRLHTSPDAGTPGETAAHQIVDGEGNVTGPTMNRAEITFEARQDRDGRPVIGLVLTREGRRDDGKLFSLSLSPDLTPQDVEVLVGALNRCVTHISLAAPEAGSPA